MTDPNLTQDDLVYLSEIGVAGGEASDRDVIEFYRIAMERQASTHADEIRSMTDQLAAEKRLCGECESELTQLHRRANWLYLALFACGLTAAWAVWRATEAAVRAQL